jgi:hypothetical protein
MPKAKGINVKLLEKAVDHMTMVPARANMATWLETDEQLFKHKCHTVGCIAGWTVSCSPKGDLSQGWFTYKNQAQKLLRLTDKQVHELFYPEFWPAKYREKLLRLDVGTREYAHVVKARAKAFIKQYGPKPKTKEK